MYTADFATRVMQAAQKKKPGWQLISDVTIGSTNFEVPGVVTYQAYANYEAGAHKTDKKAGWVAALSFNTTIDEELRAELNEALKPQDGVAVAVKYLAQNPQDRNEKEEIDSELSFNGVHVAFSDVVAPSFNCQEEPVAKIAGATIAAAA